MRRGLRVDHYRTLGVAPDASTPEIRRAYRRLARRHHPDVNPVDNAGRFVAITAAYQILSDPAARARYDLTLTPTPSPSVASQPGAPTAGRPHRVGILELSLAEATHLSYQPLVLIAGTTKIRLPPGLVHGDTIAVEDHDFVTLLHIHVNPLT